jgi:glycosyltransferase involved in cell wall biosynthesis
MSFLVGYVGFFKTMGIDKGIGIMLDALSLVPAKNVQMVFVGGKEEEIEEYKAYALAKGIQRNVIFVPVVSALRVSEYEKAMDILVIPYPNLPHFRDYGFPMKAYEYLGAQKPVIFSNLPIMAEVLGDCAVPFAPGNSEDLAKKIMDIGQYPENYTELLARAYEKAKDCTWQNRAQRIIDFTLEL